MAINETKVASIDLVARACYFKIYLTDKYGRVLNLDIDSVLFSIEDTIESGNNTYVIEDVNVPSKNGICVWSEDISRVRVSDSSGCFSTANIFITPEDYLKGEDMYVEMQYTNIVESNPVNPYNYIRWNKAIGTVTYPFGGVKPTTESDKAIECTGCDIIPEQIANPYLKNCSIYRPVISDCDSTSFYINSEQGFDISEISNVKLDIIDANWNTIATEQGNVKFNVVDGPFVNMYCENIMPIGLNHCGVYRFVIYDGASGKLIAYSNELTYFQGDENLNALTSLVEYRASQNMYYFDYDNLPNFKNKLRLHLHRMSWNPENITEQYEEDTTGIIRNYFSTPKKFYEVRTYYFDDPAHEATVVFCEHDEISINKVDYTIKTKHAIDEDATRQTHNGTFEVYENRFSRVNKTC